MRGRLDPVQTAGGLLGVFAFREILRGTNTCWNLRDERRHRSSPSPRWSSGRNLGMESLHFEDASIAESAYLHG